MLNYEKVDRLMCYQNTILKIITTGIEELLALTKTQ
jgi:hypothetical protein